MISNINELNDTIEQLTESVDCQFGNFSKKMSSEQANAAMNKIQLALDNLYVKTRLLEDLRVFTESYMQNEFKKKTLYINDIVKAIENAGDDYEDTTQIAHEIPFNASVSVVSDRDGTSICSANVAEDGKLLMASEVVSEALPSETTVNSTHNAYRRITAPPDKYRSFYILSSPAENGISETLKIIFSRAIDINCIHAEAFKGKINDISILRNDNQLVHVDLDNEGFRTETAKGLVVKLYTDAFDPVRFTAGSEGDAGNKINTPVQPRVSDTIFVCEYPVSDF